MSTGGLQVPTYMYHCDKCQCDFDVRQSFRDKPIAECPYCGGVARRVFSPVPIVFKGPGFYTTDSRAASSGSSESDG